MAVGETAGQGPAARVVSAGGGRRRPGEPRPAPRRRRRRGRPTTSVAAKPIVHEADPELERLLAEEEEIERRTREHHETPQFHGDDDWTNHVDASQGPPPQGCSAAA